MIVIFVYCKSYNIIHRKVRRDNPRQEEETKFEKSENKGIKNANSVHKTKKGGPSAVCQEGSFAF